LVFSSLPLAPDSGLTILPFPMGTMGLGNCYNDRVEGITKVNSAANTGAGEAVRKSAAYSYLAHSLNILAI
jgi:hypothetical protein